MKFKITRQTLFYEHIEVEADDYKDAIDKLNRELVSYPETAFGLLVTFELDTLENEK